MDVDDKFSPTLSWISRLKDPRLVSHTVIVLLSDTVWGHLACRTFLFRKAWFFITLLVFVTGQSILKNLNKDGDNELIRYLVFTARAFNYGLTLTALLYNHSTKLWKAYTTHEVIRVFRGRIAIPKYLLTLQECAGFVLMIVFLFLLMLEPIIWCIGTDDGRQFYEGCESGKSVKFPYSVVSMFGMILFYLLLLDLAVVSTKTSAYVLVCLRMVSEVALFLLALVSVLMAFGSSITVIKHSQPDFAGLHKAVLALLEMSMRMYDGKHFETYEADPIVLMCVFFFLMCVTAFLMNMLIAQLTCAYEAVYVDMIGYARLERIDVLNSAMTGVGAKRWQAFIHKLKVTEKTEFNHGDTGVSGALQVMEPANLNPTTQEKIKRYGGTTSPEFKWPADEASADDGGDRYERVTTLIEKTYRRLAGKGGKGGGSGSGSGTGGAGTGGGSSGGGGEGESGTGGASGASG